MAMRRFVAVALVALFAFAAPVAAAPAVVLSDGGAIEAPGALLGMDVRPGGEAVLLVGEDGWAHRIDGFEPDRRDLDVELGPDEAWTSMPWIGTPAARRRCWSATWDC